MSASETTTLVVAGLAIAAGAVVAVDMWRRSRRRRRAMRSRHPSVRPPLEVDLSTGADGPALRLEVRRGAPPLSIDIVSYRIGESGVAEWESLPIVDPIRVEPGVPTALPVAVPTDTGSVDVVVAWTAHHATGDLPASRLFRIPTDRDVAPLPPPSGTLGGWPALVLLVLLALAGLLVVRTAATADDAADSDAPSLPELDPPASAPSTDPSTDPSTAPSTDPSVATSTTAAVAPAPTTSASSPTTSASSPTTGAPSPTSSPTGTAPDTSAPADIPRVLATGRIAPCRFADACLVVGFRLDGFTSSPEQYVCEFEDGSRFTFNFASEGVEDACATGSATAAITVEVEGVRSETVTRADAT